MILRRVIAHFRKQEWRAVVSNAARPGESRGPDSFAFADLLKRRLDPGFRRDERGMSFVRGAQLSIFAESPAR